MSKKSDQPKTNEKTAEAASALPSNLLDHVEVSCEAVLGTGSVSIGKLNGMGKGDHLVLDRSPSDPIDIKVNGKTVARGEIVTVDDRFAVRLTEIG